MLKWRSVLVNNLYWEWEKPDGIRIAAFRELRFHDDCNWQHEAIEYIENLQEFGEKFYYVQVTKKHCSIHSEEHVIDKNRSIFPDVWKFFCNCHSYQPTKKEAIFDALFQFSQHLKTLS